MLDDYSLFLFDFDGLLVDTEPLHFEAYKRVCARRNCHLTWDMPAYANLALFSANGVKNALLETFSSLNEAMWDELYQEKRAVYLTLLQEGNAVLMPGVAPLLHHLKEKGTQMCIVTHSPRAHVEWLIDTLPDLKLIDHLVTREDYDAPKPAPDAYLKALSLLATPDTKAIGFEDSPRGLHALLQTPADGVLVSSVLMEETITSLKKRMPKPFISCPDLRYFQ